MAVVAIHPGEQLSEELQTLGMSAAELARNLDVPTNRHRELQEAMRHTLEQLKNAAEAMTTQGDKS